MSPLVRDDEEGEKNGQEQQSQPLDATVQQVAEKTQSFKGMLGGVGRWLASRKLPPEVKQGLRRQWEEIYTGKKPTRNNKKKKFMATPFHSFNKEKKKGKL